MSDIHQSENTSSSGDTVAADALPVTRPQAVGQSTPLKNKYGPSQAFSSEEKSFEAIRKQLDREMKDRWLGAMPVEEFFKQFLRPADEPLPEIKKDPFKPVPESGPEYLRYAPFITVIEDWIPNFRAVNTSTKEDTANNLRLKTDISIYDCTDGVAVPDKTDFSRMELWMEFKTKGVAFQDPPQGESDESRQFAIENGLFTPDTDDGSDARGQLAHYAGAQHSKQFRNFSFSVLVEGNCARFLRWEPGNAIVTAGFDYRKKPRLMAEFFWRFSHLSTLERGYDTTVQPAKLSPEVDGLVRERLGITNCTIPLFRYTIPGRLIDRGYAYGPRLPSDNRSIASRSSRNSLLVWIPDVDESTTETGATGEETTFPSTDETKSQENDPFRKVMLMFMKDTCRYLSDKPGVTILPEHEIYEILHSHKTPNIPEHVVGGDIDGGRTRVQEFLNAPWLRVKPRISALQHYRLAHATIGRELTKFRRTKELVTGVLGALKAHWHAFECAKILHRDISAGNILLTDKGEGLLIDWEMGKFLSDEVASRRPERTGTWQFMSANLLKNPQRLHTYTDDLESFLHVLGWIALRCVPAVDLYDDTMRRDDLRLFDEYSVQRGMDHGGDRKSGALGTGNYPSETFQPIHPTPLSDLLVELCQPFKRLYDRWHPTTEERIKISASTDPSNKKILLLSRAIADYDDNMQYLQDSSFFVGEIQAALKKDDWPSDDMANPNLPIAPPDDMAHRRWTRNSKRLTTRLDPSMSLRTSSKRSAGTTSLSNAKRRRGTPATSESRV